MFNHLIPLCWNTDTELLGSAAVSASSNVLIHLHDAHEILTAPVERHVYSTAPPTEQMHAEICSVSDAAVRIPPKATLPSCCGMEDIMDMALTSLLYPEACRGTGNSWLSVDWSGAWDFPTRLLVCGWSVCLHHFTPGREREAEREDVQAYCRSWRELLWGDSLLPPSLPPSPPKLREQHKLFALADVHSSKYAWICRAGRRPSAQRTAFHDACRSSCYSGCFTESINLSCQRHQALWWKLFHFLIRELWYCITRGGQGNILGRAVIV